MGHSRAQKDENHERIVATAAVRVREAGIDGVGVAELMKEVGLTHGGFYRHFASRDALVAEAVARALRDGGRAVEAIGTSQQPATTLLAAVIDGYLSLAHRDARASGCAVTTLAADAARSPEAVRASYEHQVGIYLELIERLIGTGKAPRRRALAITALSTLVGALSLARAVADEALSREILASAATELKRLLIEEATR